MIYSNSNNSDIFRGSGQIYAGAWNADPALIALLPVGYCSEAMMAVDYDETDIPNTATLEGGNVAKDRRPKSAKLTLTLNQLKPSNLAMAWGGAVSDDTTVTPIAGEAVKGIKGGFSPLAHLCDVSGAFSVTAASGGTTYTSGTDYILSAGGVFFPEATTIAEGASLHVDYVPLANSRLEALINPGQRVAIVIDGMNAVTKKPAVLNIYKASVASGGDLGVVSTKPGELKLNCEVLLDLSQPFDAANPTSRFFKLRSA